MKKILLDPFTPEQFLSGLFFAYMIAFIVMLLRTTKRDISSPRTPFNWSWSFFRSDNALQIYGNILLITAAVRYSVYLFDVKYIVLTSGGIGLISAKLMLIVDKLQAWIFNSVDNKLDNLKKL